MENQDLKHQKHYTNNGVQPIDIMRMDFTTDEYIGFLKGNVLKYLLRYDKKDGLKDLKKAKVYLDWLIECYEESKEESKEEQPKIENFKVETTLMNSKTTQHEDCSCEWDSANENDEVDWSFLLDVFNKGIEKGSK